MASSIRGTSRVLSAGNENGRTVAWSLLKGTGSYPEPVAIGMDEDHEPEEAVGIGYFVELPDEGGFVEAIWEGRWFRTLEDVFIDMQERMEAAKVLEAADEPSELMK